MPVTRRLCLALALGLAAAGTARAEEPKVFTDWRGRAIRGYDPVAYFRDGRPVEGKSEFSFEWNGARWLFSSEENRAAFAAEPEKFAPQYGGYCAYAVAHGSTASIDPEAWRIVDGRLYLNYSRSVLGRWLKDVPGYIARGDENWPKLAQ